MTVISGRRRTLHWSSLNYYHSATTQLKYSSVFLQNKQEQPLHRAMYVYFHIRQTWSCDKKENVDKRMLLQKMSQNKMKLCQSTAPFHWNTNDYHSVSEHVTYSWSFILKSRRKRKFKTVFQHIQTHHWKQFLTSHKFFFHLSSFLLFVLKNHTDRESALLIWPTTLVICTWNHVRDVHAWLTIFIVQTITSNFHENLPQAIKTCIQNQWENAEESAIWPYTMGVWYLSSLSGKNVKVVSYSYLQVPCDLSHLLNSCCAMTLVTGEPRSHCAATLVAKNLNHYHGSQ